MLVRPSRVKKNCAEEEEGVPTMNALMATMLTAGLQKFMQNAECEKSSLLQSLHTQEN